MSVQCNKTWIKPRELLAPSKSVLHGHKATRGTPTKHSRVFLAPVAAKKDIKSEVDGKLDSAGGTLSSAVDAIAKFVPESVPRPAAKGGVAVIGGLIVLSLIQKVLSTIVTLAVLAGLAYYFLIYRNSGGDDDKDDMDVSRKPSRSDDLDDPLSDARRIMDKYK